MRAARTTLRAATLHELGGAERIVEEHLERALAGLDDEQRDLAARLFNHLVTPSGTKIAHARRRPRALCGRRAGRARPGARDPRRGADPAARSRPSWRAATLRDLPRRARACCARVARRHERSGARGGACGGRRRHRRLALRRRHRARRARRHARRSPYGRSRSGQQARDQARPAEARELAASALSSSPSTPSAALRLALEAAQLERSGRTRRRAAARPPGVPQRLTRTSGTGERP